MNAPSAARSLRGLALFLAFASPTLAGAATVAENIYRNGLLASGAPLVAERGGVRVSGPTAACVNCHRRSGLGMNEGRTSIPPIAGSYLFHPRAGTAEAPDLPFVEGMRGDRDPYTDATLARAIREGIGAAGQPLNVLMPHYELDDAAMAELISYLKKLSPGAVPGVTETVLHFATIITPDADPVRRQGVLDVLEHFFADKNHYTRAQAPRVSSSRRMMFKVNRRWELHVWELSGAPETWGAQLHAKLAAEPVFAVISGVGGKTWAPVQRFCEEAALPCLFPNVDLPVVAENDFYSLYFSKGVLLEAALIAHELEAGRATGQLRRVVQVFRAADVGEDAAGALGAALPRDVKVIDRSLPAGAGARELAAAVSKTEAGDALVLWLRRDDIAALGTPPAKVATVFMSGRMAGLEAAPLPAAWRSLTHLTYPVDLPDRRRVRVDFPMGWFRIRQIPVVALEAQVDTDVACGILSDTINHLVDAFVRDYLVERIEAMLGHRVMNGYYPRLALAPGQRFASKGGYVTHFAAPTGTQVIADGDWIVP